MESLLSGAGFSVGEPVHCSPLRVAPDDIRDDGGLGNDHFVGWIYLYVHVTDPNLDWEALHHCQTAYARPQGCS